MSDRFHFHWQNLNEKPGDRLGSGLRHGRAWLRFLGGTLRIEWVLPDYRAAISVAVRQGDGVGFGGNLGIPLIGSLFWRVEDFKPIARAARWLLRNAKYDDRELSVRVHDWTVWRDAGSWSITTPKWRDGCFHIDDFVLGKSDYSRRTLIETAVNIGMPEASYPATVKIEEATWKRPRWFAKRMICSEVKIPKGIPFPGKGENSWDCGQDAVYGQSGPAGTVEKAVASVVESVLRSRRRYGGSVEWRPQKVEATT